MTRENVTAFTVGAHPSSRSKLLTALISAILANSAAANPSGHNVVHGTADVQTNGAERVITTQDRTIIDWNSFSIDQNETTRFIMQGTDLAVLNRVVGAQASQIDGSLVANGRVYLINPNGVLIGASGMIDTQSFIASTRDVSNADFLDGGELLFSGTGTAEVHNLGTIDAADGDVLLFGKRVSNSGVITASQGVVALAAGDELLLAEPGSPRLLVSLNGLAIADGGTDVNNAGTIAAAQAELQAVGGNPFGLAVNSQGVIAATGVDARDGRVYLTAAGGRISVGGSVEVHNANGSGGSVWIGAGTDVNSSVNIDGTIDVSSQSAGGVVTIDGSAVRLNAGSEVLLSGTDQLAGGLVIGQQGPTDYIEVAQGATIESNSNVSGGGVWLEAAGVRFNGRFDARDSFGQARLTILGHDSVEFGGRADLRNLADPTGFGLVEIASRGALYIDNAGGPQEVFIDAAALQEQLEYANVWLSAGSLTGAPLSVLAPITWQSAAALSLTAMGDVNLQGSIDGANAGIEISSHTGHVIGSAGAAITARELSLMADGNLDLPGRIVAPELTLRDVGGVLKLTNDANRLDNVMFNRSYRLESGAVEIVDSAGHLTLYDTTMLGSGNLAANGDFTVRTVGDLTLYYTFNMDVHGVVTLVAANGLFNNLSGQFADVFGTTASGLERIRVYAAGPGEIRGLTGTSYQNVSYPDDPASTERVVFYYSPQNNNPNPPTDPQGPGSPNEPTGPQEPQNPGGPSEPAGPSGPQNPLPVAPTSVLVQSALGNSFEQLTQLANINPQLLAGLSANFSGALASTAPQMLAAQFMNALQSSGQMLNPLTLGNAPTQLAGLMATLNNLDEIRSALSSVLQIDPSVVDGTLSSILAPWSEMLAQAPADVREQAALLVTEYSANFQPVPAGGFTQGLQAGPASNFTPGMLAPTPLILSGRPGISIAAPNVAPNPSALPTVPDPVMLAPAPTSNASADQPATQTKAQQLMEQADERAKQQPSNPGQELLDKLAQRDKQKLLEQSKAEEEKLLADKLKLVEQEKLKQQSKAEEEKLLAERRKVEELKKLEQQKLTQQQQAMPASVAAQMAAIQQAIIKLASAKNNEVMQQALASLSSVLSQENLARIMANDGLAGVSALLSKVSKQLEATTQAGISTASITQPIQQQPLRDIVKSQPSQPEQQLKDLTKTQPPQELPAQQPSQVVKSQPSPELPGLQLLVPPTDDRLGTPRMPRSLQDINNDQLQALAQEDPARKDQQPAPPPQKTMPGMMPMNNGVQTLNPMRDPGGR